MQTAEKQAEILKDQGNLYFKKERLAAAIEAYTEVFHSIISSLILCCDKFRLLMLMLILIVSVMLLSMLIIIMIIYIVGHSNYWSIVVVDDVIDVSNGNPNYSIFIGNDHGHIK